MRVKKTDRVVRAILGTTELCLAGKLDNSQKFWVVENANEISKMPLKRDEQERSERVHSVLPLTILESYVCRVS